MLDLDHVVLWDAIGDHDLWGVGARTLTINPISASIASRMAAAAEGGGTYTTEASQPVACLASRLSLNTGSPRWVWPASVERKLLS